MKASNDDRSEEAGQKPVSRTQLDFELEFFNGILERSPDYVDVLRAHANNLTAKGLYARGLDSDRRLVRLRPKDPLAHYNLACSYSLLSMTDAAIAALGTALKLGYRDLEYMLRDSDLANVRRDARFMGLVSRYVKKPKERRKSR